MSDFSLKLIEQFGIFLPAGSIALCLCVQQTEDPPPTSIRKLLVFSNSLVSRRTEWGRHSVNQRKKCDFPGFF